MKEQLYIKKNNRYVPYEVPKPDVSDTVFRRINGRYEPIGMFYDRDYLTEGVWVVRRNGWSNGRYLREVYAMDKVSDVQCPTIAEIGGLDVVTEEAISELGRWERECINEGRGVSVVERYKRVVGEVVKRLMGKGNEK